ncbi:MAG: C40 family peptidase [Rhizobiaceae bacterium]|nr:C40 family peptidase [Rhizobiaceae bacterium]
MNAYDRRLHAFRTDLADRRLEGAVEAERFVVGHPARIVSTFEDLRRAPDLEAPVDTQLLMGDEIRVFEEKDGWLWAQAARDGYVGYLPAQSVEAVGADLTHRVVVPRTFLYPGPDLRLPSSGALSLGASVTIVDRAHTRGTDYAILETGEALIARHIAPVGEHVPDYVSVAETLLMTPYLWGGTTGFGIDCSGLVQLSMRMAGRNVLRDTDMQENSLGEAIDAGPDHSLLRRGDLVFWKGHVAIMTDERAIIHANGHMMLVTCEPLAEAIERIGYLYGGPTSFRRP